MSLYDDLLAAGVPLASHGSDLYAKVTDDSRLMIEGYQFRDQVQIFKNAEDGAPWYDIPFAYVPFWTNVAKRVAAAIIPDVGIESAPDSPPCCYVGGVMGLHAVECPQHHPETCPTCQDWGWA